MKVRDLMNTSVVTIDEDATAEEAASLMMEKRVGCLPVMNREGRLVGIITESDFEPHPKHMALGGNLYVLLGEWMKTEEMEEMAHKLRNKRVKEFMGPEVFTVDEDTSVADAVRSILQQHISHLPILRDKELVGIVTRHDLIRLFTSDKWGQ